MLSFHLEHVLAGDNLQTTPALKDLLFHRQRFHGGWILQGLLQPDLAAQGHAPAPVVDGMLEPFHPLQQHADRQRADQEQCSADR